MLSNKVPPRVICKLAVFSTLLFSLIAHNAWAENMWPNGVLMIGDGSLYPNQALVVDKSKKKLHVVEYTGGEVKVVTTYDSDLGKLKGDKMSSGDRRTPEGIYFFETLLQGSGLDPKQYGERAFTTNYPNFFDRGQGKTGDGIWLHAIDEKQSLDRGSRGCVVVRNDTIRKLSSLIKLKTTPFIIFDQIQWTSADDMKKHSKEALSFIDSWKKDWESKNIDGYISHYGPTFKSGKMNLDKWRTFKSGIFSKYQNISVKLSQPMILEYKDKVVARFYQNFESSEHSDFGEKTLYAFKTKTGYQIVGEDWQPVEDANVRSVASQNLCCTAHN